jgi:fumarylacetoacetate (FAA) hydrolase
MKLASYKDGSRDGQLLVVSRDLGSAHYATGAAHTLQQALDDWNFIAPQLQDLYVALNQGRARHAFAFEPARCMAPLPRAFQWVAVDPAAPAATGWSRLRQGSGDAFLGPCDDMPWHDPALAAECAAGLAVISGDLPARANPEQALDAIRLLMLVNDWCGTTAGAAAQDAGTAPVWPGTAFSPVAVTLDELGAAWQRGRLKLPLQLARNGRPLGQHEPDRSALHFGQWLSLLCRQRPLGAGTVLGCTEWQSPALEAGDQLRIEIRSPEGQSLFGAITQSLALPA